MTSRTSEETPPVDLAAAAPQRVAAALREELLEGKTPAGMRLREEDLAERFSVGRHTVRAAIRLLVERGLVVHERNRGAMVPPLTQQRIDEIFGFRTVLEIGALKLALARGADLSGVQRAVENLEALAARGSTASWRHVMKAHSQIHHAIVEASANAHIVSAYARCEDEVRVLLTVLRPDFEPRRLADLHRALLDDLLVGGETAVRALADDLEVNGRAGLAASLARAQAVAQALPGRSLQD